MPDLPTRGPMARPLSREVSPRLDRYEVEQEPEEPPARSHPFPSLQTFPSRSFAVDDRGDDGLFRRPGPGRCPAGIRAGPDRFEFPTIGASDRAPRGASAYPEDTYPTVPDQHHPAEPESADTAPMEDDRYPRLGSARQEASHPDAAYPQEGEHEGEYDAQYADAQDDAAADAEADRYEEYDYADGDDGAYEDDEPGGKRRNTIKIALAVLGVVVFGSAAAFGYRAVFHGGTSGPPPLIRADTSPTKVVPAPSSADGSSKPINDRLGGERMVSREEQPADLRDAGRNANGALVVPQAGGGTGVSPYPAAPVAGAAAPASPTEPKRVRTVTIHADPAAPAAVVAPLAATAPATTAPAPPRVAAVPRPASQPPQAPQPAAAPLALTPQSQPSVAAVDTAHPAAPARATPRGADWMVQLSAQKTEAEAQSAFRAAQTKYSVLSGYQPQIRKKDRGERGIFYGAQVGPFSHEEANQLCDNLKTAGSDCFVLKN